MRNLAHHAALLVLALALAACDAAGGGTRFQLSLADAAVDDAEAVVLAIAGVELEFADGEKRLFHFDPPRAIDVLAASDGRSVVLLDEEGTPAATYVALRLLVAPEGAPRSSVVRLRDGTEHPLVVPAEARASLELRTPILVSPGMVNAYTLHLDLRRSLLPPSATGKPYRLHPVLQLLTNREVGAVRGTVAPGLIRSGCRGAVYVFAGAEGGLDDVDGDGLEPYASARVPLEGSTYGYTVAFLPAGDYRIAFTCDAGRDDPLRDDRISFVPAAGLPLRVEAQKTQVVNLGEASNPSGCPAKVEASGGKPNKPNKPGKPKPDKPKPDKPKPEKPKPDKPEAEKPDSGSDKPESGDQEDRDDPRRDDDPPRRDDRDGGGDAPSPDDDQSGSGNC